MYLNNIKKNSNSEKNNVENDKLETKQFKPFRDPVYTTGRK